MDSGQLLQIVLLSDIASFGNAHIEGVWHDEHGRYHTYSYELTPEGQIIKRKGKLPPGHFPGPQPTSSPR